MKNALESLLRPATYLALAIVTLLAAVTGIWTEGAVRGLTLTVAATTLAGLLALLSWTIHRSAHQNAYILDAIRSSAIRRDLPRIKREIHAIHTRLDIADSESSAQAHAQTTRDRNTTTLLTEIRAGLRMVPPTDLRSVPAPGLSASNQGTLIALKRRLDSGAITEGAFIGGNALRDVLTSLTLESPAASWRNLDGAHSFELSFIDTLVIHATSDAVHSLGGRLRGQLPAQSQILVIGAAADRATACEALIAHDPALAYSPQPETSEGITVLESSR